MFPASVLLPSEGEIFTAQLEANLSQGAKKGQQRSKPEHTQQALFAEKLRRDNYKKPLFHPHTTAHRESIAAHQELRTLRSVTDKLQVVLEGISKASQIQKAALTEAEIMGEVRRRYVKLVATQNTALRTGSAEPRNIRARREAKAAKAAKAAAPAAAPAKAAPAKAGPSRAAAGTPPRGKAAGAPGTPPRGKAAGAGPTAPYLHGWRGEPPEERTRRRQQNLQAGHPRSGT
jgi:hypothetical protein